jgi:phytoene/squalene synthetase
MTTTTAWQLTGVDAVAEAIAARDANNLYRTSCFFQDPERYRSFCAQYAIMRVVDDRIDGLPARASLTPPELAAERDAVHAWRGAVEAVYEGQNLCYGVLRRTGCAQARELLTALMSALQRFPVPRRLWQNFFDAMARDVEQPRFRTYTEFLAYAEGATAAPTTIYLYLLTSSRRVPGGGPYLPPAGFDLLRCGRSLGLFAYLTHIVRDLPDDIGGNRGAYGEGLLYFAQDDLARHRLTPAMLYEDRVRGCSRAALRRLISTLIGRSRAALAEGQRYLTVLNGQLSPDCALILQLIIALYVKTSQKIEACGCDPMRRRHTLTEAEKEAVVRQVLAGEPI